jgi:hypothetical protein
LISAVNAYTNTDPPLQLSCNLGRLDCGAPN